MSDDPLFSVLEQYLSTRRRVREIERNALSKIESQAAVLGICTFCGNPDEPPYKMIHGAGNAKICNECVVQIHDALTKDKGL